MEKYLEMMLLLTFKVQRRHGQGIHSDADQVFACSKGKKARYAMIIAPQKLETVDL